MNCLMFSKTRWWEAPRLRHQVAELLAERGHGVHFFQRPSLLLPRARPATREGISLYRYRNIVHPQLRFHRLVSLANNAFEKREIRRLAAQIEDGHVLNFNYEYEFLREIFPHARIVTIINDDFIDGTRWFSRHEATRALAATLRSSYHNLAVSYPLVDQIRRFTPNVSLFLPWSRSGYRKPPRGKDRPDVLYWGYINYRIDIEAVQHVLESGIRIHFVGPVYPSYRPVERLLLHPNAALHPAATLEELGEIVDRCSCSILPYDIRRRQIAAITVNNRAFEILSYGLPLLYSALPGLIEAPPEVIRVCRTPDDYVGAAKASRAAFDDSQETIERFLQGHTAEQRYHQLMRYLEPNEKFEKPRERA